MNKSYHLRISKYKVVSCILWVHNGNLGDISNRALNILEKVSLVACEDTRQTRKIMSKYTFTNNLISFHKYNSNNKSTKIINLLKSGESVALVSDAGMPSICDPGEELVKDARSNGINITCIPGPSAIITALALSGLPSSRFTFKGFLPKKKCEREKILHEISKSDMTTILFESPHRLKKTLNELKCFLGGEREIQISRELTKKFEEHIGNNINEVINHFEGKEVLGEFTLVIKGISKQKETFEVNEFELKKELIDLINAGLSLSQASNIWQKKIIYLKNNL